jgi:hypothetical protein
VNNKFKIIELKLLFIFTNKHKILNICVMLKLNIKLAFINKKVARTFICNITMGNLEPIIP